MPGIPGLPSGSARLLDLLLDRVDDADEAQAIERVRTLRDAHPDWTTQQLVDELVMRKVRQTASIGAATAAASVIPVLGTIVALTVGAVADLGATLRLQSELLLEIAEVYARRLSKEEKRRAFMLIAGLSAGGARLVSRGGSRLSLRLTERFAERWLARALPFAGIAVAAGTNALSTYLIGRRATAYFALGPEAVGSWTESLRALSGVDERRLASWVRGALRRPKR
ncbi:MAG TPA: hypothetical protein VFX49_08695 [Chloroflexota bacterium]|nr:hypothetical protein [Chloroflexota bacterium]